MIISNTYILWSVGFESMFLKVQLKEVSETSPAKEEENESEAKDGAREEEKWEKHGQMLKLHFKQVSKSFVYRDWNFENLSCTNVKQTSTNLVQYSLG